MIQPGQTLGLLGGGQLGRMFASEALRMGYRIALLDPDPHAPAATLADHHLVRDWSDADALDRLVELAAAATTEFENVPAQVLRALSAHLPVRPGADAIAIAQDRIAEKQFLAGAGIATVRWAPLESALGVADAALKLGAGAAILKTARLGYDGKGQERLDDLGDLGAAWERLGGVPCIVEQRVELEREVSVMVARGHDGSMVAWPVGENVHVNGILHTTVVPASIDAGMEQRARRVALDVAEALEYVGVLGVECFITTGGELLVNEIAPRPHNSGHWTLDAAVTSQFEQQVRVLTGMPLGSTRALAPVAMVNLLGDLWQQGEPQWERVLELEGVRLLEMPMILQPNYAAALGYSAPPAEFSLEMQRLYALGIDAFRVPGRASGFGSPGWALVCWQVSWLAMLPWPTWKLR